MKDLSNIIKVMLLEKKDIVYSILFGYLAGISAVGLFAVSGYMISKSALEPPLYALTVMIALVKLFGFARALSRYAERYFSHKATFTMLSNIRVSFFEKLEPLAPHIFHTYRSGDLLSRIVGDVERLQHFFLRVFYPPIVMIMIFLSTIVFTMFYSFYVGVVLLIGLAMTGFIIPAYFAINQKTIDQYVREGRGQLSTDVTELLYGFRDLKIYQKLEGKKQHIIDTNNIYIKEQERQGIQEIINHSINTVVTLIFSWLVLALGSYLVTINQMDGLFLAMLVMTTLTVFENVTSMAILPIHLENSRHAATRLFSIVQNKNSKDKQLEEYVEFVQHKPVSVLMNQVTFTFTGEPNPVLNNVSLNLPSGSKTAIVGPSGSGKSTIFQLLLKFQNHEKGEILFNNRSIDSISQKDLWKGANIVLQENHFFFGSIRDNLQLAKDGLTEEEMDEILEKVNLKNFSLSDQVLEKGENLSGGEKQRLAIARAMLKGERLWLLDEPTSSIDSITEKYILDNLLLKAKNDTLVLISHRLTGLEKMDQIIVLENGKIIESGTFEGLINNKGYFYQMKQIERSVLK